MTATPLGACAPDIIYSSGTKTDIGIFTLSRAIPAGHTIVISGVWEGSGGTVPNLAISDDSGNTGTAAVSAINGTTRQVVLGYLPVAVALASGAHITLDGDATRGEWAFKAFEWSGLADSPGDQTASNGASTGVAMTAGTTGTLAQASEVVFAAFAVGPGETLSVTSGSGFTLAGTALSGVGAGHHQLGHYYQIVSATTAVTGAGTQNSTGAYAGATMTLKAAAVQTLLPTSDTTTTSWVKEPTGAASFAANNADADDATYNRCSTPDGSHPLVEVLTTPGSTPPTGASVVVRVRARANSFSSATGVLSIIQGATTRASATVTLTSAFAWYELTLTPTEVSNIAGGGGGWAGLKASFNPTAS